MKASQSSVGMSALAWLSAPDTTTYIRAYFSLDHILGASHFARQSASLEATHASGTPLRDVLFEHRAYVMGAVLSSTAFLEAAVNEVFADAADERDNEAKNSLRKETVDLFADEWWRWQSKDQGIPKLVGLKELKKDRHPLLRKYQLALHLAEGKRFPRGEEPYQATCLLLDLRNALTHPVPESSVRSTTADSISGVKQSVTASQFERSLRGKFAESALFASSRNAYFPHKCLGHGCAEWSVKTARKFADDFFGRIGLRSPLDAYEDRLRTR